MTRNPLFIDLTIVVIAAILVLILTPGVAIAGTIALLVLLTWAVTLILGARRRRAESPRPGRPVPSAQRRPQGRRPSAES